MVEATQDWDYPDLLTSGRQDDGLAVVCVSGRLA